MSISYTKYLLYLCVSRSNFVNASQEKFSPVSKVLHRIQNKFPWQSVSYVCQIYLSHSLLTFCSWRQGDKGDIWKSGKLTCYQSAYQMAYGGFCWFQSQAFCVLRFAGFGRDAGWGAFCRRS